LPCYHVAMENSRETKKNNGPLPEFHELFCHEYQKEKHIHDHQTGHFGPNEASFVSGNDRKFRLENLFRENEISYHGKVWEKKDPSTSSKPKKAKKDEKSRTDQQTVSPAPTSEGPTTSSSIQPSPQSAPIIKSEILQNEPKIENEPIVKIEQELQSSPNAQALPANFENDVDMSADPLDMSLNLISSSETFNFDVRAHQGLNLDTECSFNEFMPQGVATDSPVFIQSQHQTAVPHQESRDVFDCNIKSEILSDETGRSQTQMARGNPIYGMNQSKTGGPDIYQIDNEPQLAENGNLVVRNSGQVKSRMVQSPSGPPITVQGSQNQQIHPRTISGPKIVQAPIQIEPQLSEEEIRAKKEKEKAAKKGELVGRVTHKSGCIFRKTSSNKM